MSEGIKRTTLVHWMRKPSVQVEMASQPATNPPAHRRYRLVAGPSQVPITSRDDATRLILGLRSDRARQEALKDSVGGQVITVSRSQAARQYTNRRLEDESSDRLSTP